MQNEFTFDRDKAMQDQALRFILKSVFENVKQQPELVWRSITERLLGGDDPVERQSMESIIGHRMNERYGGNPLDIGLDGETEHSEWIKRNLPSQKAIVGTR